MITYLQAHKDVEEYARTHHLDLTEEERSRLVREKISQTARQLSVYVKPDLLLTTSESKILSELCKEGCIVSRNAIARSLWGEAWSNKYSDWDIDAHLSHIRKKLNDAWEILTVRNQGVIFRKKSIHRIIKSPHAPIIPSVGILPTDGYLSYMNDPTRIRKTLKDLFISLEKEKLESRVLQPLISDTNPSILIINSYSYDNVDAVSSWLARLKLGKRVTVVFTNFDERALDIHRKRVEVLGLSNIQVLYDDIRSTRLSPDTFSLVMNDFRLNFNTTHKQNRDTMKMMYRIMRRGAVALVSVVVDARYESDRFGRDQEKAPIHKQNPWVFSAAEGLERCCFTVPYYKHVFRSQHFKDIYEFDFKEGKQWANVFTSNDSLKNPYFRRFIIRK